MSKLRLAVHKFTSCDGCQLAFLNAGLEFFVLNEIVEIVHFAEAGLLDDSQLIDISIIEGSITTESEKKRIQKIRQTSRFLITIGACATAGGLQALRNAINYQAWMSGIYASPQHIDSLSTSTPISAHVKVDCELWGCPVNTQQVMHAIHSLIQGSIPQIKRDAVCLECKRQGNICVVITKKQPCMGPVTQTGCGALCPSFNRACYACYGPAEINNTKSLGTWFIKHHHDPKNIAKQFLQINNQAKPFQEAGQYFKGIKIVKQ